MTETTAETTADTQAETTAEIEVARLLASATGGEPLDAPPGDVEIRRNRPLSAALAGVSLLVATAWFVRAAGTGRTLDWALCAGLASLAAANLLTWWDARLPLLVADAHGVRLRLGRSWRGIPWSEVEEVEHLPRRLLHDGRLTVFPLDLDAELQLMGAAARRHTAVAARLWGAPLSVPLGWTTRVAGGAAGLTAALVRLADGVAPVIEVVPMRSEADPHSGPLDGELAVAPEERSGETADGLSDGLSDGLPQGPVPVAASPTPAPLREPVLAKRAELTAESADASAARPGDEPPAEVEDDPARSSVAAMVDTGVWRSATVVIDDLAERPTTEPVIGPELSDARRHLGLSIEQLADRTRIRPHVIEAIEIDDFLPCGGDFYARGHLRTLARVLGVDAAPLLATYDGTYADAPIDPRRVFEAELSGRSPIRGTRGGPNWSVLVAAVMAVVLAWSVARLVMDHPAPVVSTPNLSDGSAGLTSGGRLAPPVPVVLTAVGGGARVVVRDGGGSVVFQGGLAFGQSQTLRVSPPVRVQSTDGSLHVTVDGQDHGALGTTGQPAQNVFTAR